MITDYLQPSMMQWRHAIHRHPELGFEETTTAALVAGLLEEWGVETHREIGGTGVVGALKRGRGERMIGLRADMDALAITERNGYRCRVAEGVVGASNVSDAFEPPMTSEDFAFMLQAKPGCYLFLGNDGEGPGGCGLHNPNYDFNDEILTTGADFWVSLVESELRAA